MEQQPQADIVNTSSATTGGAVRLGWAYRAPIKGELQRHGPLIAALIGIAVVAFLHLPVADLQAANARATAYGLGARTYWFSWFGGDSPGKYSMFAQAITSWLGVMTSGCVAVLVIAVAARALLKGVRKSTSTHYLIVSAALANLVSGRIAFCLAAAVALAAIASLREGHPLIGGLMNAFAALVSPLATGFALLALVGFFLTGSSRKAIGAFAGVSLLGPAASVALFGAPGPMSFDAFTLLRLAIVYSALLLVARLPAARVAVVLAAIVSGALFVIDSGVGANIDRYVFYVLVPLVWALTPARRVTLCLAMVPAVTFSGAQLVREVRAAERPSARASYFASLVGELRSLPEVRNHRVEVLDTPTHRASAELATSVALARGWESQTDRADNPLFFLPNQLTAVSYRNWLDQRGVGWVAVPDDLNSANTNEAALIAGSLPYLKVLDRQVHWTIYAVVRPQEIVEPPAQLVRASPAALELVMPARTYVLIRVRPSPYLQLQSGGAKVSGGSGADGVVVAAGTTAIRVWAPVAGTYRLSGRFSMAAMTKRVEG
ncbi:hypothetical protein ACSMXN_05625 [Jatrophihabitans sp. DSM 45814]